MDEQKNTILVTTGTLDNVRGKRGKELQIDVLGKNVNLFITQMGDILANTPDKVDKFKLTQITVTAEISAKGSLVLLGTGVEAESKGGVTFVFTRT